MIGIPHDFNEDGVGLGSSTSQSPCQETGNTRDNRKFTKISSQKKGETSDLSFRQSLQIESCSPSSPRTKRESTSSTSSTDWCTLMEEDDRRVQIVRRDLEKYKRATIAKLMRKGLTHQEAVAQVESDEVILVRRQKQLEYGKNNKSYEKYNTAIPRKIRLRGTHPTTPDKFQVCSRRSWESQVRIWKRNLHEWSSTGLVHGNRRAPKRMLSADICSDTSSENDHPMDTLSLDTSASSLCFTSSCNGSRSSSPLVPETTYASIAAMNLVTNPKTPNASYATPAEGEVVVDPKSSPAPIDPAELLMALRRVEVSPPETKKNRKSLVHEFSKIPSKEPASKDM